MAGRERHMTGDYPADLRSDSSPVCGVLSPAAMGVHDVALARTVRGNQESRGAGAFGEGAVRRADDGLRVASRAEGLCECPEGLLAAAPGALGIDVCDGQGAQKMRVSLSVRGSHQCARVSLLFRPGIASRQCLRVRETTLDAPV